MRTKSLCVLLCVSIVFTVCASACSDASTGASGSRNKADLRIPASPDKIPGDAWEQVTYFAGGGPYGCEEYCVDGAWGGSILTLHSFEPNQSLRILVYELSGMTTSRPEGKGYFRTEWNVRVDQSGRFSIALGPKDTRNYGFVVIDRQTGKQLTITQAFQEYM